MTLAPPDKMRWVVFLARSLSGENLRHAQAIGALDGVRLLGICEQSHNGARLSDLMPDINRNKGREGSLTPLLGQQPDRLHAGVRAFEDMVVVADVHDPEQLIAAARGLAAGHGRLHRIVTTTETLLEPAAQASEALGLAGMSVSTVRRVLDKSRLKGALDLAGVDTARDGILMAPADARRFIAEAGFPIVLKPLSGSGGLATWRIRTESELDLALGLMRLSSESPMLAEEYLSGQELCLDTITVAGQPRFHSICCYRPSILEALEDPLIQWSCVMPRNIGGDRYRKFIEQGLEAVRALAVGDAMTHMEGFILEGGGVRFTDATLRPAGARIAAMLAYAYDMDPYQAWARVAVDGGFDGPWERRHAVGTIFLRGSGNGLVNGVHGIGEVEQQVGEMLVDGRLPRVGAPKAATYTGDGYLTVRHPKTEAVEVALDLIAKTIRISYTDQESDLCGAEPSRAERRERLQDFNKLSRPAWEDDSVPIRKRT
jgi:hypothetical protein